MDRTGQEWFKARTRVSVGRTEGRMIERAKNAAYLSRLFRFLGCG